MLGIFGSKNKKLVKKWEDEHEEMVVLAHKVIEKYTSNKMKDAKKALKELNILASSHLMNEDIEFFRLMKNSKRKNHKIEIEVNHFKKSFKDIKIPLLHFLSRYSKDDSILDQVFFDTFIETVEVLGERIKFEEDNLYIYLKEK